ncbi:Histidinol-phosphate aminotransferase [Streptomyces californicus]
MESSRRAGLSSNGSGSAPSPVSRAIAQLAAEGLVATTGSGAFRARPRTALPAPGDTSWQEVSLSGDGGPEVVPRTVDASGVLVTLAAPPPGVIEFNGGYLHASLQPERAPSAALARAGRRPGACGAAPTDGLPELRSWFAREIGPALSGADVLITAGGPSALATALRALAPPGAPVLVESPTYPGMLAAARATGLRPVPVPVDADGIRPELLADAFRATGARVLVTQPLFQNPTGAILAPARRPEVLAIARAAGAFVIEDDFARRLVHDDAGPLPPPLAADDPDGVVVHVCSLTKVASPSLRVGALAARGPVLERLRGIQVVDSFFVPRPLQEAALESAARTGVVGLAFGIPVTVASIGTTDGSELAGLLLGVGLIGLGLGVWRLTQALRTREQCFDVHERGLTHRVAGHASSPDSGESRAEASSRAIAYSCESGQHAPLDTIPWTSRKAAGETEAQCVRRLTDSVAYWTRNGNTSGMTAPFANQRFMAIFEARPGYPLFLVPFVTAFGAVWGLWLAGLLVALAGAVCVLLTLRAAGASTPA